MSEKIGRYEVDRELGRGSTATVYLGRDGDEEVALKVLHRHLQIDPLVRERFRREVTLSRTLEHPGIVRIHDLTSWNDQDVVVMEYCGGGSLAERMDLQLEHLFRIAEDLADALSYAHGRGVIHRDIKPRNILFDSEGRAKLCDFGSAHVQNLLGLTSSTMFIGTPQYLPPESLHGGPADPKWDLYSLGAVLYEAVAGEAHRDRSFGGLLKEGTAVIPLRERNPAVPPWFSSLVMSLLGPQRDRPADARTLAALLKRRGSAPERKEKRCLFCDSSMPEESPVCLECGKRELDLSPYTAHDAESLVITKVPERAECTDRISRILRILSGDSEKSVTFITEDIRMYSKAERNAAVRLPARLIDDISPAASEELLPLLEGIGMKRKPSAKARKRIKRGPLIEKRSAVSRGSSAGEDFLLRTLPTRKKMTSTAGKHLFDDCLMAVHRYLSRQEQAGTVPAEDGRPAPELSEDIRQIFSHLSGILGRIEDVERSLAAVSLGEIAAEIQALTQRLTEEKNPEEIEKLIRLKRQREENYTRFMQQEESYARMSQACLAVLRQLRSLTDEPEEGTAGERLKDLKRSLETS